MITKYIDLLTNIKIVDNTYTGNFVDKVFMPFMGVKGNSLYINPQIHSAGYSKYKILRLSSKVDNLILVYKEDTFESSKVINDIQLYKQVLEEYIKINIDFVVVR